MDDLTPVMENADRHDAQTLSVQGLKPPMHVPGYEQETFLGRGSFGEVWHAIDSNNGRQVVIKFFTRRGGLDWSLLAREVEKLRYLFSDRYVVQLFDVGWDANPPYYVMEYMEHGSLDDQLRAGPIPVDRALAIMKEITVGLVHAHGKGIIHCDLKPGNILLDQDGKPRLADFGQSRLSHEQTGALGTLFYMAPEQADLDSVPDARWDVYGLGAILYQMLTGSPPYRGEPGAENVLTPGPLEARLEAYRALLKSAPPPSAHRRMPGVDAPLATIIDRCLATHRKDRFPNVQAVLSALDARETRLAQRPLLVLGGLGPALVVLVMAVIAGLLFKSILDRSEHELVGRASESNRFAATSLAERFALEVDKRWRILESEAADPKLRLYLERGNLPGTDPALGPEVQSWIQDRHRYWNARFSPSTAATYWYALDRHGRLRSQSPVVDSLTDRYFGYRDYFHGQGRDLKPDAPVPPPIRRAHRSVIYRDKVSNSAVGTLTVPVWSLDPAQREPVGVLAMDMDMGHFTDFRGTRNQFAVLIDLRPDASGRKGLIVEHPYLDALGSIVPEMPQYFLPHALVERGDQLRLERIAESRERMTSQAKPGAARHDAAGGEPRRLPIYHDPVGNTYSGEWLAVMEPVVISRSRDDVRDSGWVVLVQERYAETLRPLHEARQRLIVDAVLALVLVVLIVTALWYFVIVVLREGRTSPLLRIWRRWRGLPTIPTSLRSAGSSSSTSPDLVSSNGPTAPEPPRVAPGPPQKAEASDSAPLEETAGIA